MTQKLIEAALAYGRAHAEFIKRWNAWRESTPEEYTPSTGSFAPRPIYVRDVDPAIDASNAAKDLLCVAADELYAGSAGILALADEATAREPTAPDSDQPATAGVV